MNSNCRRPFGNELIVDKKTYASVIVGFLLVTLSLSACGGGGDAGGSAGPGEELDPGSMLLAVAAFSPWPNDETVELIGTDATDRTITSLASDGAGGYDVTYSIGGTERRLNLRDDSGTGTGYFSTQDRNLHVSLDFLGDAPEYRHSFLAEDYEHLRIAGFWADHDGDYSTGYLVLGTETEAHDLPLGSATYWGRLVGQRMFFEPLNPNEFRDEFDADVTLMFDFDEGRLEGLVDNFFHTWRRAHVSSFFSPNRYLADARFEIDHGTVIGDTFSAAVTGFGTYLEGFAGRVRGGFFGPGGNELGAVLGASRGENDVFHGYIVGDKPTRVQIGHDHEFVDLLIDNQVLFENGLSESSHLVTRLGRLKDTRFDGERLRVTAYGSEGIHTFDTDRDRMSPLNLTDFLLLKETDSAASAAVLGVDWGEFDGSDYVVGGAWIHLVGLDPETRRFARADAGSFVDGPALSDAVSDTAELDFHGFVRYAGRARGFYAIHYDTSQGEIPAGSYEIGRFSGSAQVDIGSHGFALPGWNRQSDFGWTVGNGACVGCTGELLVSGVFTDGRTGAQKRFIKKRAPFRLARPVLQGDTRFAGIGHSGAPPGIAAGTFSIKNSSATFVGSYETFGPWARGGDGVQYHRDAGDGEVVYGVGMKNGTVGFWAYGPPPTTSVHPDLIPRGVIETITWSGGLSGFTASEEVVGGVAELTSTLTGYGLGYGELVFTELESWPSGQPGERGTGAQWGDGELRYSAALHRNSFSAHGETGYREVSGHFFGDSHQVAVGTVLRDNLNAIFWAGDKTVHREGQPVRP